EHPQTSVRYVAVEPVEFVDQRLDLVVRLGRRRLVAEVEDTRGDVVAAIRRSERRPHDLVAAKGLEQLADLPARRGAAILGHLRLADAHVRGIVRVSDDLAGREQVVGRQWLGVGLAAGDVAKRHLDRRSRRRPNQLAVVRDEQVRGEATGGYHDDRCDDTNRHHPGLVLRKLLDEPGYGLAQPHRRGVGRAEGEPPGTQPRRRTRPPDRWPPRWLSPPPGG